MQFMIMEEEQRNDKKEKAGKKRRRKEYMTIFINGKQRRVKRPPTVDGTPVDEFIKNNADPIWLLQNGMHEELHQWEQERDANEAEGGAKQRPARDLRVTADDDDLPF